MQTYFLWMYNIRLQAKKNAQPKIKDDSALNNSTLIQMSTKLCQNEYNDNDEEELVNYINEASFVSADGSCNTDSLMQQAGEGNPPSQTQLVHCLPLNYNAH